MSLDRAIEELRKRPCQCVSCGTCGGMGHQLVWDARCQMDDVEGCEDCHGSGITEFCERCADIEDLYEMKAEL